MDIKLDKTYNREQILRTSLELDKLLETTLIHSEYGEGCGQKLLVLKNKSGSIVITFLFMVPHDGGIYKCVYSSI